ncbi:MAG: hypothetical protein HY608_03860, partial [Planctomycetes bacterium]|nr:hypothetical protein [Planctomycetota bacterium]
MDPIGTTGERLGELGAALRREEYLLASGQKGDPERAAVLERFADLADPSCLDRIRRSRDGATGPDAGRLSRLERGVLRAAVSFDLRAIETRIDTFHLRRRIEWNGEPLTLPQARARLGTIADSRVRLSFHRRLAAVEQEV